jgi:hypothetical protein
MKKKFLSYLLYTAVLLLAGCGAKETESYQKRFLERIQSLPLSSGYRIPEWLSDKIQVIETSYREQESIAHVRIYQGEWKERRIYYIYDNFSSCLLCETYYEEGEKIVWVSEQLSNDFQGSTKNWRLIYEFGEAGIKI